MKILSLDTATECCSAALWIDGRVAEKEMFLERGHAEHILPLVDRLLQEAGMRLTQLDAIAFGRGPGSFTGVRLAASLAQGLSFAARLPVVPISDLRAVAQRVRLRFAGVRRVVVCNDARMHEVYWACFEAAGEQLPMTIVSDERVSAPAQVTLPPDWAPMSAYGAGKGFAAYSELRAGIGARLVAIDDSVLPHASEIASLAAVELDAGRALGPGEALPVYLRDEVAQVPI